jgi:hypothetical protein
MNLIASYRKDGYQGSHHTPRKMRLSNAIHVQEGYRNMTLCGFHLGPSLLTDGQLSQVTCKRCLGVLNAQQTRKR